MLALAGYKLAVCLTCLTMVQRAEAKRYRLVVKAIATFVVLSHIVFTLLNFFNCWPVCASGSIDHQSANKYSGGEEFHPLDLWLLPTFPACTIYHGGHEYLMRLHRLPSSFTSIALSSSRQWLHHKQPASGLRSHVRLRCFDHGGFDCPRSVPQRGPKRQWRQHYGSPHGGRGDQRWGMVPNRLTVEAC